jgi:antitoxin MazE
MQSEIKQWGNSAAIRLSRSVLAKAGLDISSPIDISATEGKIVIEAIKTREPVIPLPFSEADLLSGLTPHTAHADELAPLTDLETDV